MTFEELDKLNREKIAKWFKKNEEKIRVKAGFPKLIPVSEQIRKYKEKNHLSTFASDEALADNLVWNTSLKFDRNPSYVLSRHDIRHLFDD